MKVLCICSAGNCRSVTTAGILKGRGYDALAAGVDANTPETINQLCDWADIILLATEVMIYQLPDKTEVHNKVKKEFIIGPDLWGVPFNPELTEIVKKELEKINL